LKERALHANSSGDMTLMKILLGCKVETGTQFWYQVIKMPDHRKMIRKKGLLHQLRAPAGVSESDHGPFLQPHAAASHDGC